jgi:hypothetical protein
MISSGGLALCLFFGIVFLLLYAKWKYERCKEELENDALNKDSNGNDIKKAGLTKIYKYSKPNATDNNPVYLPNDNDPTPQPTMIQNTMPVTAYQHMLPPIQTFEPAVRTMIIKQRRQPQLQLQQPHRQSRQIVTVRRDQGSDEEFPELDQNRQQKFIMVQKPKKNKSMVLKNIIRKVKAGSQRTVDVVPSVGNYIIEDSGYGNFTEIRDVRSPSHVPIIEIEPHNAPKVIKISRNEIVASRTPTQSNSRTQLIQSSLDKKPVILTRNIGENLNAFS